MVNFSDGARDTLTLKAGWLIDGTGAPARRRAGLRLKNGRILCVSSGDAGEAAGCPNPPSDIDLSGCTLLPGLVDAHVHLFMSGGEDAHLRRDQLTAGYPAAEAAIAGHLRQHLSHGVVAVRDGGDREGHALRFRQERPGGHPPEVLLRAAGKGWRKAGRYGKFIARAVDGDVSLAQAIAGDTDPVDHVKVINSGLNSLSQFGRQSAPQFTAEELRLAVRAAARRGLGVMVHANGIAPVAAAVAAGCRSIEHGYFMGAENLARMAELQITWVPTASPMAACAELLADDTLRDVARRTLDHQLDQIARSRQLGVPVALGTDAGSLGVDHGGGVAQEMRLLMTAGFSLGEAIACAAVTGARLLGLEDQGRLTAGMRATFVAVEGGPTGLPESLERVRWVFIDAEMVNPTPEGEP